MARVDSLNNFLTDVANSIRVKKGTTDTILASNFDNEIESIQTTPNLQSKSITITTNGTKNVTADEGYDGLSDVSVTTDVPTSSEMFTITDCSYLFKGSHRSDVIDKLLPFCNGTLSCNRMFDTSDLKSLDLSNFDTSNVTNMGGMFYQCSSLLSLDLSNLDTPNLKDMSGMFNACSGLTTLDLSSFNTSNVTNMGSLFNNCRKLTTVDLSSFNTSNVTSMSYMFYYCNLLTSLDLSNFDTSNVTNMNYMFYYCYVLETLDISNFDFTKVTSFSSMFANCGKSLSSPTTVYVKDEEAQNWILTNSNGRPSTWSTANVIIKEV